MKNLHAPVLTVVLTIALLLVGCSQNPSATQTETETLTIVATIGQVYDVAQIIAGEHATVELLLGEGVDPHVYVPTESDLEAFQGADIILYSGLNMEVQMFDMIHQVGENNSIPVVAVAENIPAELVLTEGDHESATDPHVWNDVARWIYTTEAIRDVLVETDPAHAEAYEANYEAYVAELSALDTYAQLAFSSIPEGQRKLVTAHDAFQYLSDAYGIEVFAPQGITTEAEASVADIQAAVDYVVENEVPAIFFESAIPIDTIEAIIAGAAAEGHDVAIGGELFADTMGAPGTPAGTYIGMVRHNLETIVPALGGTLPPSPFMDDAMASIE